MLRRVGGAKFADLLTEAWRTIEAARLRAMAAALGVALASAAFVITTGLSTTLARQVDATFDAARATEITVTQGDVPKSTTTLCPDVRGPNTLALSGVQAGGELISVGSLPLNRGRLTQSSATVQATGLDLGALVVAEPHLVAGRIFDTGHLRRSDRVALISTTSADKIGASVIGDTIYVQGIKFSIIGFFDSVKREPGLIDSVLIPATTLNDTFGGARSRDQIKCQFIVQTAPGAASQLSQQVAVSLLPNNSASLLVTAPPDPQSFRRQLSAPINTLVLALSFAVLLIGAVSISTAMSNNVSHRVSEIGLRKALGATSLDIVIQVTCESSLVGLLGSGFGGVVGAYTVLAVALTNGWAPVLDLSATVLVCLSGALVGALSGVVAALKASNVVPSTSLRA